MDLKQHDCDGEDQLQFTGPEPGPGHGPAITSSCFYCCWKCVCEGKRRFVTARKSHPSRRGVASSSQTPLLREEKPRFKTRKSHGLNKLPSWVPKRTETKVDCAGEGQQQFNLPTNLGLDLRGRALYTHAAHHQSRPQSLIAGQGHEA
jgi:hypothetical protein